MNNNGNQDYRVGMVVGFIFILIFAGYIILLNHSKAYGQDTINYSETSEQTKIDMSESVMKNLHQCYRVDNGEFVLHRSCNSYDECIERINVISGWIVDLAVEHDFDPWLLAAIAFYESNWNPFAVSKRNARGILQINPRHHLASKSKFIHNRNYRIKCKNEPGNCQKEVVVMALKHLEEDLVECNNNLEQALTMYNTGHCVVKDPKSKRFGFKRSYVNKIYAIRNNLKASTANVPACCDQDRSGPQIPVNLF